MKRLFIFFVGYKIMQVYLKVPVIVKVMKGQSHGQGRAIKRQLSGVNSSKVRAKSNTGGSKEAPGDCNAPFSSNSILIFLRNANMPMMIKSENIFNQVDSMEPQMCSPESFLESRFAEPMRTHLLPPSLDWRSSAPGIYTIYTIYTI